MTMKLAQALVISCLLASSAFLAPPVQAQATSPAGAPKNPGDCARFIEQGRAAPGRLSIVFGNRCSASIACFILHKPTSQVVSGVTRIAPGGRAVISVNANVQQAGGGFTWRSRCKY